MYELFSCPTSLWIFDIIVILGLLVSVQLYIALLFGLLLFICWFILIFLISLMTGELSAFIYSYSPYG